MELPVFQFLPIASCAIMGKHGEEPGFMFFTPHNQVFIYPEINFSEKQGGKKKKALCSIPWMLMLPGLCSTKPEVGVDIKNQW